MTKRVHGPDPADPAHCQCGWKYPEQCRGGHPIMRKEEHGAIMSRAAAGLSFRKIAAELGMTTHLVSRVVHG